MKNPETVSEYIANEPVAIRKVLRTMRALTRRAAPRATEKLAWGMPTLVLEGNLLHFAAFKNHLSLFPGKAAMQTFQKDLHRFQTSKGTIQFPYDQAIPVALVTRIVKFCVKQNLADAAIQAKKKALEKRRK